MASESPKKAPESRPRGDVVLVYGRSEDGRAYDVLRQRGCEVEAGTMRPLDEGKPIHGEIVRLKGRMAWSSSSSATRNSRETLRGSRAP